MPYQPRETKIRPHETGLLKCHEHHNFLFYKPTLVVAVAGKVQSDNQFAIWAKIRMPVLLNEEVKGSVGFQQSLTHYKTVQTRIASSSILIKVGM